MSTTDTTTLTSGGSISDAVIDANAKGFAPAIRWLRAGLKSQKNYLRERRDRAFRWAFRTQMFVIALGFVASLAAIFSRDTTPEHHFLFSTGAWQLTNIVVPLLMTAFSGALGVLDFRGVFGRNSSAFNVIASVQSEIEYAILLAGTPEGPAITAHTVEEWNRRVSAAMLEHSQEWERTMSGGQKSG